MAQVLAGYTSFFQAAKIAPRHERRNTLTMTKNEVFEYLSNRLKLNCPGSPTLQAGTDTSTPNRYQPEKLVSVTYVTVFKI